MSKTYHFYKFPQNNSGGSVDVDKDLCENLIIEAESRYEANEIAEDLGCYWEGVRKGYDCKCCGDRWHKVSSDNKLDDDLEFYGCKTIEELCEQDSKSCSSTNSLYCRIFYKNGEIKEIFKTKTNG